MNADLWYMICKCICVCACVCMCVCVCTLIHVCMWGEGYTVPVTTPLNLFINVLPSCLFLPASCLQVWYMLGWVCYLQQDKPEEEEIFRDSAKTYLTRAKKVYMPTRSEFVASWPV